MESLVIVIQIYKKKRIHERHRHRYEVNPKYVDSLQEKGLQFVGWSPDNKLVEMIELSNHTYFVACQFHPEFKSRPLEPHPLFISFLSAAKK